MSARALLLLPATILYLPLDERFTTRDAFLNLARVAAGAFTVSTPPLSVISLQRRPADLPALDAWVAATLPTADASVVSLELYLYGGLIASRCSNDTTAAVLARLDTLTAYAKAYPNVTFLLGTVVMRIPAYNTVPPTEDPWYWEYFGADLFTYSYYLSKYNATGNSSDLATALAASAAVPPSVLEEFVWRRRRNFNVTSSLLQQYGASVAAGTPLFHSLYITLDDNAAFGFNIQESVLLRQLVAALGLEAYVKVYPGADEVGLTMLARLASDVARAASAHAGEALPTPPALTLVFRKPDNTSLNLIPNYEGQPMVHTLMDHIEASGATAAATDPLRAWLGSASAGAVRPWRCGGGGGGGACAPPPTWPVVEVAPPVEGGGPSVRPPPVLLVNNFGVDEFPQIEAPNQPTAGRSPLDYAMFTPSVCGTPAARSSVVSFASNRYSNGADTVFVEYMLGRAGDASCAAPAPTSNAGGLGLDRASFSGWNTDGNSIGTAVANLVLLHYFASFGPYAGARAGTVRLIAAYVASRRPRAQNWGELLPGQPSALPASPPCDAACANSYFNVLRLVEDCYWQAGLRGSLDAYVSLVDGEDTTTLAKDLDFYERFSLKVLSSRSRDVSAAFGGLGWNVSALSYPWNRTFEIGIVATQGAQV